MGKKKKRRSSTEHVNKYAEFSKSDEHLVGEPLQLIQDTFDFHNRGILRPGQVRFMAEKFLIRCVRNDLRRVLIITGKGNHSKMLSFQRVPMVKATVRNLLNEFIQRRYLVESFSQAAPQHGGEGAYDVFLIDESQS